LACWPYCTRCSSFACTFSTSCACCNFCTSCTRGTRSCFYGVCCARCNSLLIAATACCTVCTRCLCGACCLAFRPAATPVPASPVALADASTVSAVPAATACRLLPRPAAPSALLLVGASVVHAAWPVVLLQHLYLLHQCQLLLVCLLRPLQQPGDCSHSLLH
jgi:hypothetical protein